MSAEEASAAAVFHFPEDFRNAGNLRRMVRLNKRVMTSVRSGGGKTSSRQVMDEEKISLKHCFASSR